MDAKLKQELDAILYLMLENQAPESLIQRLNGLLEDPEVLDYATHFYLISAALRKSSVLFSASFEPQQEIDEQFSLLQLFAEEERIAPTIEIPVEKAEPEAAAEIRPAQKNSGSKTSLYLLITSMAALILFFASIRFIPNKEQVAVLAEAVQAKWAGSGEGMAIQDPFYNTDAPRVLKSGTIEIEFNYGARVVVEGPAEFSCKSDNMIHLHYGRIFSRVPRQATGFTVSTDEARIVDLGTEFGVQAGVDGTVELHVTHGRTSLITGDEKKKNILEVLAGHARQICDQGRTVTEIALDTSFAQKIDTKTGLIWTGSKVVNLADIVGGGNGFGTGTREQGIDPLTDAYATFDPASDAHPTASNAYRRFEANPFIDGVFVPNGAKRPQVVSSTGKVFADCPASSSRYYAMILNGTTQTFGGGGPGLSLDGTAYGTSENPAVFMHTNQGITFDLAAIRNALHGTSIVRFESVCGISQTAPTDYGMANLYVLVDGQVRFVRTDMQKGQSCAIHLALSDQDRFLTLVTVESGDKKVPAGYNSEHGDWCLFGRPVLRLE